MKVKQTADATSAVDCKNVDWQGNCPGGTLASGLGEYVKCEGNAPQKYASSPPPPSPVSSSSGSSSGACKDKKGKWRDTKCNKKQKKCDKKKKIRKKCQETCCTNNKVPGNSANSGLKGCGSSC